MAVGKIASWSFAEEFLDESALFETPNIVAEARERASIRGLAPVLAGSAAQIRTTASLLKARNIIQIGAGSGVLSLYLLNACPKAGLTLLDSEPENLQLTTQALTAAELLSSKVRTINGNELQMLGKLTKNNYDLLLVSADHPDLLDIFEQARQLVHSGGAIIINNVMHHDTLPATNLAETPVLSQIRQLVTLLKSDPRFLISLSPAGDGVLTVVIK